MRSGHLALLMFVSFAPAATAQTPAVLSGAPDLTTAAGPDLVVDRIMALDRSDDGRVARHELLERMQPLVDRGDLDGDGALDSREIQALAAGATAAASVSQPFPVSSRYAFGDLVGESSSSHIEDAVNDLRLAAGRSADTIAIVEAFRDEHHAAASAILLEEMEGVLTAEQMADFREVVKRQLRAGVHTFHGSGDARATFSHPNLTMIVTASDHERRVGAYSLSPARRARADAALLEYRERLRPGDAGKSALLARLADVLDENERNDLWAALQRRPLVEANAAGRVPARGGASSDVIFVRVLQALRPQSSQVMPTAASGTAPPSAPK